MSSRTHLSVINVSRTVSGALWWQVELRQYYLIIHIQILCCAQWVDISTPVYLSLKKESLNDIRLNGIELKEILRYWLVTFF